MDETIRRRTIYVGEQLSAFLASGSTSSTSVSERMEQLAARYMRVVDDLAPQRWSKGDWHAIVTARRGLTLQSPPDVIVLGARLRQQGKQGGAGHDLTGLAYRYENLKISEQIAVVDVAERMITAKAATPEEVAAWLEASSIPTTG